MESSKYDKKELGEAKISQMLLEIAEELLDKESVEEKMEQGYKNWSTGVSMTQ